MKKIVILIFMFSFIFLKAFAHPIDISTNTLSIKNNYISATTFFHSYEIEYLLNSKKIVFKNVWDYFLHEDIIKEYIKKNIKVHTKDNKCKIENILVTKLEEYQVLTSWMEITYWFSCEKKLEKWEVEINFFNNFPLQTNKLSIYDANISEQTPFSSIVLTPSLNKYSFDLSKKTNYCKVDSDWDWISDEMELVYKTDPKKIDTDNDFYTDYEEIFKSFPVLDRNLWPWQEPRYAIPKEVLEKTKKDITTKQDCEDKWYESSTTKLSNWLLSNSIWNNYFIEVLKNISRYISWNSTNWIFYILISVVFLWFIHALGPGHSKSLLISYILDKNKSFFDGMLYITIFSITHLIDIVVLFLFTKIFFSVYDISNYMLYIQRVSVIILIFFSIFLIYRSYKNIKLKKEIKCESNKNDVKSSIFLWFVSGLAPCTFWWSIFLLLFSLWNFNLILPMILALWIWIFLCLFLVMVLTFVLRKKVFEKVKFFSMYSSIFSSTVLLLLSIYLISILF